MNTVKRPTNVQAWLASPTFAKYAAIAYVIPPEAGIFSTLSKYVLLLNSQHGIMSHAPFSESVHTKET